VKIISVLTNIVATEFDISENDRTTIVGKMDNYADLDDEFALRRQSGANCRWDESVGEPNTGMWAFMKRHHGLDFPRK
jgi:hypothetical protein